MNPELPNEVPELPDEITQLWNRQEETMTTIELALTDPTQLTEALQTQHRREERRLLRLNFQEVMPAIALAAVFAWLGVRAQAQAWGFFGAAAISIGIAAYMVGSTLRQRSVEASFDDTLRGQLQRSLSQASHRADLYRTVLWWYLLPSAAAIALALFGFRAGSDRGVGTFELVYGVSVVGLGAYLYRLNRRIGREQYEPQVAEYQALLAELD